MEKRLRDMHSERRMAFTLVFRRPCTPKPFTLAAARIRHRLLQARGGLFANFVTFNSRVNQMAVAAGLHVYGDLHILIELAENGNHAIKREAAELHAADTRKL
jgi:hypothetical protein